LAPLLLSIPSIQSSGALRTMNFSLLTEEEEEGGEVGVGKADVSGECNRGVLNGGENGAVQKGGGHQEGRKRERPTGTPGG